jgi:ribosomal subunit interface protein
MLQKFEIQAVHTTIDDNLRKYVTKKIGGIDKYLSRHDRESAHGEVQLKETKSKDNNTFVCEVLLHLPHATITVRECAINMYASIDIVEAKLKHQIKKHKEQHEGGKLSRHLMARFNRQPKPQVEI